MIKCVLHRGSETCACQARGEQRTRAVVQKIYRNMKSKMLKCTFCKKPNHQFDDPK